MRKAGKEQATVVPRSHDYGRTMRQSVLMRCQQVQDSHTCGATSMRMGHNMLHWLLTCPCTSIQLYQRLLGLLYRTPPKHSSHSNAHSAQPLCCKSTPQQPTSMPSNMLWQARTAQNSLLPTLHPTPAQQLLSMRAVTGLPAGRSCQHPWGS